MGDASSIMEMIIFTAILVGCGVFASIGFSIKTGYLTIAMISFSLGTLLFGLSRLMLYLFDQSILTLDGEVVHLLWHMLFYLSLASFSWGVIRIKAIAAQRNKSALGSVDILLWVGLLAVGIVLFTAHKFLNTFLLPVAYHPIFALYGAHHAIAFVMGAVAAYYFLYIRRSWGSLLGSNMIYLLAALALLGLQHLWELLTENLKFIAVSDTVIEGTEQIIVLLASLLIAWAALSIQHMWQNSHKLG